MIFANPVKGTIRVNAANYPTHPLAWKRPAGNHEPAVTHDFGPSSVSEEPAMTWPGGEADIFGKPIPAGTYKDFHRGLDIGFGDTLPHDVLAMGAGKVTTSGKDGLGTEVIVIDHGGGFASRYAHLSKRLVAVGAVVANGALIGKSGNTGSLSTGWHLHAAVTKDGLPVDLWRRLSQNTTTDPDQEADVPTPSSYIPGQIAQISNATGDVNVRAGASSTSKVIRQIPKGTVQTWAVTCWEKGELVNGSDQWLVRWNGAWEYVHKSNVSGGPTAPAIPAPGPTPTKLAPGLYEV